jgi:hypothetical protein
MKLRKNRLRVAFSSSFVLIIGTLVLATAFTAVIHAKTCSKLTGFPGFLQRVGMLGVAPCATKIGGPACGAGKVCTTGDSKTGTCKNISPVGKGADCVCVANTVSKGLQ